MASTPRPRPKLVRLIVVGALLAAIAVTLAPAERAVEASDGYILFMDVHGPDDAGAQADLVSTAVDYSHLTDIDPKTYVRWTWDETDFSGANTGDACALFDTIGDGLANYAFCVSIGGSPATQLVDSPRLYECTANNLSNTRCSGDTSILSFTSTCSVAIIGTDTVATCEVDMDDVGGASSASLSNTCSFNSSEPNSNPPDCVLEPGMGVTVAKDVTDDAAIDSDFAVNISGAGAVFRTITGDGSFFVPLVPGTHSVEELGTADGWLLDNASCTSGTTDSFTVTLGGTESTTCTFVNRPAAADQTVTKTFTPATVAAGTAGNTFTIGVANTGERSLGSIVVNDTVDATLTVTAVAADNAGDCTATSGNAISCTFPALAVGETGTVTVTYSVDETVEPTSVLNTASASSDLVAGPTTGSATVTIVEDVALMLDKSFGTATVAGGTTGNSFVLTVTNGGTSDAENVQVTDTVDPTLTVTGVTSSPTGACGASSGQLIDCTFSDIGGNSSATLTITYDVAESAAPATVVNTATVASDEQVATDATASIGIVEDVDLVTTKTFTDAFVDAGAIGQTFTITVTNNGTSDAENVRIIDAVDPLLMVSSVTSATADCSVSSGQTVDCTELVLGAGETASVVVTYSTSASADPASISNTASVTSDEVTTALTPSATIELVEDVVLELTKSFSAATVAAGSTGRTFTLEVTNTGASDAENVAITDTVDPRLTVTDVASSVADCSSSSGNAVSCSIATLAAGQTATVTVTYSIAENVDAATISNTGSVTSDEVVTAVTITTSVDVIEDVDLVATKTFAPSTIAAGSTGNTFNLSVTNNGVSDADDVLITDVVDPDLQVVSVSMPGGDCSASSGQDVSCSIASIGAGQTLTVTVTYSSDSGAPIGTETNSFDIVTDEQSTSAGGSVEVVAGVAFQTIKSFDAASVEAGTSGHGFTLSVTNSGPSNATSVTITDTVHPALTVTSVTSTLADCSGSSGQDITCTVATIPAGQTVTVLVTFDVAETVDATTITNTFSTESNELPSPVTASDTIDVVEDVQLSASKVFSDTNLAAGSADHSFTIQATNSGSSDADNVLITDVVDPSLVVTSVSSTLADCAASSGQNVSCSLTSLAATASATVTVNYSVAESAIPGTVSNSMTFASDEGSTTATDTVTIFEDVTLDLSKTFATGSVDAGVTGQVLTLTVTNTGLSDAENVLITDVVDPALVVSAVSSALGDCSASSGNSVSCSIASLGAGDTLTVVVTYDVDPDADTQVITNTANASSDEDSTLASDDIAINEEVVLVPGKSFSPSTVVAGGSGYSFTLTVANTGISNGDNIRITDSVDSSLTVTGVSIAPIGSCSATAGNAIDCTVTNLPSGGSVTVTVVYDVDAAVNSHTLFNTVTASADDAATATDLAAVTITESATLTATKTFAATNIAAGGAASTFEIRVVNTGISTADNVAVVDVVDSALIVTGVTADVGSCAGTVGNSVNCSAVVLAPGAVMTVIVTYTVDSDTDATSISNTAQIDSDETATPLEPTDDVTVVEDVALAVDKDFAAGSVAAGSSNNTFTLSVTNSGTSSADNVVITDVVPSSLVVTGVSTDAGACDPVASNTVDCTIATLAAGATATVTVTYSVDAANVGATVSNTSSTTSDEVTTALEATAVVSVIEDVVLSSTKTFSSDSIVAGTTGHSFTVSVSNNGLSVADNVLITDVVVAALAVTGVSITGGGSCAATIGNNISCSVATLSPGDTVNVTVTFDVAETTIPGAIANTATVTSDELVAPVAASDTIEILADVTLESTKVFSPATTAAGTTGNTFTITVTNTGTSAASNVSIIDIVDSRLTVTGATTSLGSCAASSGNTVDCTIASLLSGQTAVVTVTYDLDADVETATISNTATIDSDQTAAETASDSLSVIEDVAFDVSKTFSNATATAGVGGYAFTLSVTNSGSSTADNVSITDTVDGALSVVSVTPSAGGDCAASSGQLVDCSFADLAPGATATVTVTYAVGAGVAVATYDNTVSATSDEVTTAVTATDSVDVDAVVEFTAAKTFSTGPVAAGTTDNTFTIEVSNSGPSDASGVTINDVVDPALTVTSVVTTVGSCTETGGTIDCTIGDLLVGQAAVVTVTYDVDADVAPQPITNTATIDSAVPLSSTDVSDTMALVEDVSLATAKTFGADPVAAGTSGNTFSIAVTNTGTSTAENVDVVDVVDSRLTVISVNPSAGTCLAVVSNTVDCTVASLAPGATATVTVAYDVDADVDPATVPNAASVTSDEVLIAETPSATVDIVEDATLSAAKAFTAAALTAGTGGYTFTVAVTNTGTSTAENVRVVDTVDARLTVTGIATTIGTCTASSGSDVDCAVTSLPPGATLIVTVTFDVDAAIDPGSVTNIADVTSDEVTTALQPSDTVFIVEDVGLDAAKSFDSSSVAAGTTGNEFSISVTNVGTSVADNVDIVDVVDSRLALTGVSVSAGACQPIVSNTIDCTVATLSPGATVTVTAVYSIDADIDPASITNTAQVTSDEVTTAVEPSDTLAIVEDVVLSSSKAFAADPVAAGTSGNTFTISVTNDGSSTAENVRIVDTVDTRLTVTNVAGSAGSCAASSGNSVDCTLASLAAGATFTVTVTYSIDADIDPATITNTAQVTSDEVTTAVEPSDTLAITENVVLTSSKTFAADPVAAGTSGNTFTISVTNDGTSTAENVNIVDVVDSRLTVTSISPSAGSCTAASGNSVDCTLASLAPGATFTVTVTYSIDADIDPATITNTAQVTSDEVTTAVEPSDTITITEDVSFTVAKTFAADPVAAGTSGNTFTISVTNTGSSTAEGVRVIDTVDARLTVTNASASAGSCAATIGNDVDCTLASLAPGATFTVTVTYSIDADIDPATITNTAQVTSDEVTTAVEPSDTLAITEDVVLTSSKAFAADPVAAGTSGNTFTISVTNDGTSTAENVRIVDTVDTRLTVTNVAGSAGSCAASSGNSVDCTLASLAAGATFTVTVTYSIDADIDPASITNTAQVTSDEVTTAVEPSDTLAITENVVLTSSKTFAADPVAAGTSGNTFTISVTNDGTSTAENVNIVDVVDSRLTVTSISPSAGSCTAASGNSVDCTLASLAPGATFTVTVTYSIDADIDPATITNTAQVTSDEITTALEPTDTLAVVENVSFSAVKAFTTDPVVAGSTGNEFTIAATNTGTSTAENVNIVDVVDSRLTVTSISPSAGSCTAASGNSVDCTLASLAPGATFAVTVTYSIDADVDTGSLTNTAQVTSDEVTTAVEPSDTVTTTENVVLTSSKTFAADPVAAGTSGNTFTISVTNDGTSTAENVNIVDTVDPTLTVTDVSGLTGDCTASSGNDVDCTLASLAAGATFTVTVTYSIDADIDPATITNTAQVTSDEVTTAVEPSDTITIIEDVVLSSSKAFAADPVAAGTSGNTFTISVTNDGTSTAENVNIVDVVDSRLTVTSISPSAGSCTAASGNSVDCTLGSLAAGATFTVTVTYSIDADVDTGSITNTAQVTSDEITTAVEPSDTLAITEDVVLTSSKTFAADPVAAGTSGNTFTISVTNDGTSTAENVNIVDVVDSRLTVTSISPSAGSCTAASGNSVDCTLATLAAGATVTVTVTYSIDADIDPASITNTAQVTSDEVTTAVEPSDTLAIVESVVLSSSKAFAADPVAAGTSGNTFTISVTNDGSSTAENVRIVDTVDTRLTVTNVAGSAGSCAASSGNSVDCTLASLAAGATFTVTVTYSIDADIDPATITNTAQVTSDEVTTAVEPSDTITIIEDVVLSSSKAFAADPVAAGTSGNTFTISVANDGTSTAENVRIVDTVDTRLTVTNVAGSAGSCAASSGNSVDCTLASLADGATFTVTVTYSIDADIDPATITNTAQVTSDEVTTAVEPSDTITITEDVSFTVAKTFAADPVAAGTSGNTFTISVTNTGSSTAEGVRVIDTVDARLTVTNASASAGSCAATIGNDVDCTLASLAPGATFTVTVTYSIDADIDPATITNTAQVTSDEITTALEPTDTLAVVEDVSFSAVKAFTTDPVVAGSTGNEFTIAATNTGTSTAENVNIVDVVDSRLTVTAVSTSIGTCEPVLANIVDCAALSLAPLATMTVTVSFDVDADIDPANITNTAQVTSDEVTTPVEPTDTVDTSENVSLSTAKVFLADPVPAGTTGHTFTISATNTGISTAENVNIADTVDSRLTVTSISPSAGSCTAASGNSIECTATSLAPGATVTVTVTYSIDADIDPATITNTAQVTSDEITTAVEPSDTITITEDVSFTVVKAFVADPVAAGTSGNTFTISATNTGTSTAENVDIVDSVDPRLAVTGVSASAGSCAATVGNEVDCTLASLAPGVTWTVTVTYSIDSDVDPATITNTAGVTSDEITTPEASSDVVDVFEDVSFASTKAFAADPLISGTSLNTFTISVTNDGLSTAENVTVVDMVDARLTVTNVAAPGGTCVTPVGNDVDCTLASLAPGATWTITVTFDIDAAVDSGTLTNVAQVTSDEITTPQEPTATVAIAEDVRLLAVKIASLAPVAGTEDHTFTISVTNNGSSTADDVELLDVVDARLVVTSVVSTLGGDCSATVGNSISCLVPAVAPGETVEVTITYSIDPSVPAGTVVNTASVSSEDSPATESTTVSVDIGVETDLVVTKIADGTDSAVSGEPVSWLVTVTNNGPSVAREMLVTENMPEAVDDAFIEASSGSYEVETGRWRDLTVAPGETVSLSVTAVVAPMASGELINSVLIEPGGDAVDPDMSNNTGIAELPATLISDLSVVKSTDDTTLLPGDTVNYTIVVTNDGPGAALAALIEDDLPTGLANITWTCTAGDTVGSVCGVDRGTGDVSVLVDLMPDDTAVIEIAATVRLDMFGELVNTATANVGTDPDDSNNTSTVTSEVLADVDLHMTITTDQPDAEVGDRVTVRIQVVNAGPSTGVDPVVTYVAPPGTEIVDWSVPGDACTLEGDVLTCEIPDLDAGDDFEFTVDVLVTVDSGSLEHSAIVSVEGDRDPTNNQARAALAVTPQGRLVATGASSIAITQISMGLASLGLFLTLVSRRRRNGATTALPTGVRTWERGVGGRVTSASANSSAAAGTGPGGWARPRGAERGSQWRRVR